MTRRELVQQLAYAYASYEREIGEHCLRDATLAARLDRPIEAGGVSLQSVAEMIVFPAQRYAGQGRVARVQYFTPRQLASLAVDVEKALPKMRRALDEFEGVSPLEQIRQGKRSRRGRPSGLAGRLAF